MLVEKTGTYPYMGSNPKLRASLISYTANVAALRDGLRAVQAELSLPQLVCLLTIASSPGLSVNDVADACGIPQQTASRHVSVLLGRYETVGGGGPAEALIHQGVSDEDPRKRSLFLTQYGEHMVTTLLATICGKGGK